MAKYRAKCQELLRFIPDLQCHKCQDVPGPNEKNRYSCVDSHTLCEKDKLKCPCGSVVGKNPSPILAKLMKDLPWMCQNYKRGCREIKRDIGELEFHQRKCIFRKVYCPDQKCPKASGLPRNFELLFKDVTKHLIDYHADSRAIPMHPNKKNVWMATITDRRNNFEQCDEEIGVSWSPGSLKMTSTSGDVFFFEAKMTNDSVYCWVNFFGSSDAAKDFIVNFTIQNLNYRESFIYEGPVHTLDKKQNDIIGKENCFSIKLDAVVRCLNNLKCLNIMITIKNRIEMNFEESDESKSGESDDSEDKESDESEKKPSVKKRRRS